MCKFSLITYQFFIITFIAINSNYIFSLHHQSLNQTSNFDPEAFLSGDAELIDGAVHLNRQINSSGYASVIQSKKPIKFIESKPISISTDFLFSISGNGRGLSCTFKLSANHSDKVSGNGKDINIRFNDNYVAVKVGGSSEVLSDCGVIFNNGVKFHAWVNYEASSKQIEVRVSKSGGRPVVPGLIYPIDLSGMWKDEEVFVGLSSDVDDNVAQSVSVYSWRFMVRVYPKWLHSIPMNTEGIVNRQIEQKKEGKKRSCNLGFLTFGCVALVAVALFSLWEMFFKRYDSKTPAENKIHAADFRYGKIGVELDVESVFEDVKK